MPFVYLLLLALICIQGQWPQGPVGENPTACLLSTGGGILVLGLLAGWLSRHWLMEIQHRPEERREIMRRFRTVRQVFFFSLLAFYLTALYGLGWGWIAKNWLAPAQIPGREIILLLPFLAGLVVAWWQFYRVERVAYILGHDPAPAFPGRSAYIFLQARHHLLLVIPPLLLLLIEETILVLFPVLQSDQVFMTILAGSLVATVFVCIPWILRLVLGLKPLPEGPLRSRLLDTARRLKFRCNDILVWNTRNTIANAMVTGSLPFLRYVILTDHLIQELEPEEVEAVFGHEVGHIMHHHMAFYLGFLMASLVALVGLVEILQEKLAGWLEGPGINLEYWGAPPLLTLLASYIFLVFGFLSRRCERQADLFGCRTVSCEAFINALEKVARINGIPRERPGWLSSWQHSTIARRVDFLQGVNRNPALADRFQRRMGMVKWAVALILGSVLAVLWFTLEANQVWAILR